MRARSVSLVVFVVAALSGRADAECCRVVKTDAETPSTTVRVCEPGPAQSCASELFTGALSLGQSHDVCAQGATIVYQELDPAQGAFDDPVAARCEGGDVEL